MKDRPAMPDLEQLMDSWSLDELEAFFSCVRANEKVLPPTSREELVAGGVRELFWAYNSKTFAESKRTSAQALKGVHDVLPEFLKNRLSQPPPVGPAHEYSKSLTYEFLSPLNEAQGDSRGWQKVLTIGEQVRGAASRRPATRGRVHPA